LHHETVYDQSSGIQQMLMGCLGYSFERSMRTFDANIRTPQSRCSRTEKCQRAKCDVVTRQKR
ncbi:unnamed protein product, partial [Nesidiocoris tenuis]